MSDKAKRGRILLVDDSPEVLEVISLCLEEAGYEVSKTWDSREAFGLAKSQRPDAIILDFWMTHLNGAELAALLKADAELAPIPIGLLTAVVGVLPSLLTSSCSAVLTKPATLDELLSLVDGLMRMRGLASPPDFETPT